MPLRSKAFPRRLGTGLILLALWLQVLAPAVSLPTPAEAADAVIHAAICGQDVHPDTGTAAAEDLPAPSTTCDRCPFCRCTAVAPVPAAPEAALRRLRWRPVAWPTPPPTREPRPPRRPGLARAPPRSVRPDPAIPGRAAPRSIRVQTR